MVWSNRAVPIVQGGNDQPRIGQIPEPPSVEAAIPLAAVEAFNECVLRRFARLDVAKVHTVLSTLEEARLTDQLGNELKHQSRGSHADVA